MKAVEGRLGAVEGRLGAVEGRLGAVEGRLEGVEVRLTSFEGQILQLRTEMHAGFSTVQGEFAAVRQEIKQGDEETRRFMRVLHEDLVARIAVLQEQNGQNRPH
jgi:hypothetical protein